MPNWSDLENLLKQAPTAPLAMRPRGQVLEVTLPHQDFNGRCVSVFVLQQQEQWIVTDGGWLSRRLYGQPGHKQPKAVRKLLARFRSAYRIHELEQDHRGLYYYLMTPQLERLPAKCEQLAQYVLFDLQLNHLTANTSGPQTELPSFRQQADLFLQQHLLKDHLSFGQDLEDLEMVRFHVMAEHDNKLHLINYVTGSTPTAFLNAITRAIVNFELAAKSRYAANIQEYYCIVNDEAEGYLLPKLEIYLNYLNEKSTRPYLLWSQREAGWPADTQAVLQTGS